jgi:DinB superfamily
MAARLQFQHLSIREITAGISPESLRYPVIAGKWSAFENIAHLAAYQPVFIDRLERLGREASPAFGRYVAGDDPQFPGYLEKSPDELLACIDSDRVLIFSALNRGGEAFFEKTGSHPLYGLLTVPQWTEFFLLHEAHHLFTIFRLVQELRRATHPIE